MQLGTVIAGLAAAGGLAFSGWTGYYSVQVARDQLNQSREGSEKELQRQAALISTWTQKGDREQTTSFVANRSLDPVHQLVVGIATGEDLGIDWDPRSQKGPKTMLYLGSVPPCSRVTIPGPVVANFLGPRVPSDVHHTIAGVFLVDVHGQGWVRLSSGPLQKLKLPHKTTGPEWTKVQTMLGSRLLGKKHLGLASARPGGSNSPLDSPQSLKECGTSS